MERQPLPRAARRGQPRVGAKMGSLVPKVVPKKPLHFYRFVLRELNKLPADVQEYYKHSARQQFNSHSDESDPQRVEDIINQSVKDIQWLLKKYDKNQQPPSRG